MLQARHEDDESKDKKDTEQTTQDTSTGSQEGKYINGYLLLFPYVKKGLYSFKEF